MVKSTRMSAEERRILILEAALDVFAAHGFSGARTREIASRAGISETLIYRHFETKDDLYRQALEHLFSGHPVDNELAGVTPGDDESLFYNIALHVAQHTREDPRIVRLHLFEALEPRGHTHDLKGRDVSGEDDTLVVLLTDYISKGMGSGSFMSGDAGLSARLFMYWIFMAAVDRQTKLLGMPEEISDEKLARTLATQFLDGLRVRK